MRVGRGKREEGAVGVGEEEGDKGGGEGGEEEGGFLVWAVRVGVEGTAECVDVGRVEAEEAGVGD